MILENLSLVNFKNYSGATVDLDPRVNIFTGLNGQGKTNVLDAIHYLSLCKSYFNPIDSQNIRHGADFFVVEGKFTDGAQTDKIYCGVKKGQRKIFRKNKEDYDRLADHIGQYPSVVISPYDKDLISEGSEVRRRFVDGIISQFRRSYLDDLMHYNKVLKQRNSLLKYFWENRTFDPENLALWSSQLVELAEKIFDERKAFIEDFEPVFKSHYAAISGNSEDVGIAYASHLEGGEFAQKLTQFEEKDRRTSYTNAGTHKDDFKFLINGYPLKKFGSQGQQKTFLIALKLAQFDIVRSSTQKTPVLLLDDIFDKIDDVRVQHLMQLVSDHNFGQIFITDTHADRISGIFNGIAESKKVFNVKEGAIDESRSQ
ncbi:MAG TPA: DNA replication/repair protein RecF [Cryomorphaceae bacterium]|nr:DNA replication/repair protein RecF [Cryomorphaceae bacterium]